MQSRLVFLTTILAVLAQQQTLQHGRTETLNHPGLWVRRLTLPRTQIA
jgi:hypothetical protein